MPRGAEDLALLDALLERLRRHLVARPQQVRVAADGEQHVVDVVREPARERPDALHALDLLLPFAGHDLLRDFLNRDHEVHHG